MKIREMLDRLDEISRRDFLKGLGATAGLVAVGAPKQASGQTTSTVPNKPQQIDVGRLKVKFQPDADAYYPSFAKRAGEQGQVVIRLIIVNEFGEVAEVRLLQSSGFPRLDRAAMEIGKRFVFFPFQADDMPPLISTNLLITFKLNPTPPRNVDQYPSIGQIKNSQVSIAEEEVDEDTTPDAVKRIEQLIQY